MSYQYSTTPHIRSSKDRAEVGTQKKRIIRICVAPLIPIRASWPQHVLRGDLSAEEALNSNCAKHPRIVRCDRDQSLPAAALPSGEIRNEKAVKINCIKHHCVVCCIATQAHRPRNALNGKLHAEKPQIVVACQPR